MAYINKTGLPSVTQIIKPFIDSDWFSTDAAERGTAVHEACYSHLVRGFPTQLDYDWQGYYESFVKWCGIARPQIILTEKRLTSKIYQYCGQPDFIGLTSMRDGVGLIDFKTSLALEKWHRLQCAGYRFLAEENKIKTEWSGVLRLRRDGTIARLDYFPDNYNGDFHRFLMSLNLYNFFK